ncbi:MAG: hypothetical protein IT159_09875 [Bryobacterales bacterium]|nr:hypothetical protein [Bryobacterales bacterium]
MTVALAALAAILMVPGASLYYESGAGAGCTRCHEMNASYDMWHGSSHREVGCPECHGGAFTPELAFHWNNASRVYYHLRGEVPAQIRIRNIDVLKMVERCQECHRQEYAQWRAGPHSADYSRIFTDKTHNTNRLLMDDCLRCHGMHYEGGIQELVSPLDRSGPWRLLRTELAGRPTMPCLTCHGVHRHGPLLRKAGVDGRVEGPKQELNRPSLAFYDRRTQSHIPVAALPLPEMLEGERAVRMSRDQRQALCYQCHAAEASRQVGSGDDRTAVGVHEGISCLSCHLKHGQKTRASCAECHPKMSNCGLEVETMDTTFRSAGSKHNIHWVKCVDCHPKGVPKKKENSQP